MGLQGDIPAGGWTLPEGLVDLQLQRNSIGGTLSAGWSLPWELYNINVSQNLISGTVPERWVLPEALEYLDLSSNQLEGESGSTSTWRSGNWTSQ